MSIQNGQVSSCWIVYAAPGVCGGPASELQSGHSQTFSGVVVMCQAVSPTVGFLLFDMVVLSHDLAGVGAGGSKRFWVWT